LTIRPKTFWGYTRLTQGNTWPASLRSLLLVTLTLVLGACSEEPAPAAEESTVAPVVNVTVQKLKTQVWQGSIRTFGVVEAQEEVNVAAELSGTVETVHVNEGDRVKIGQLLLELDSQKQGLALQQAGQQVNGARAALDEARLKLQRRRNLSEQETISKEVLDNALLAVDAATATYQQALVSQQLAERELADTRIFSPTAGLVDIQAVEVGEAVMVGASLITLQAMQGLRVHTWVSEADIRHIRAGGKARVIASGLAGREFRGSIEWVGVSADPDTGNFPVKLILTDETDTLRPGMTATAVLEGINIPDVLLLPESALVDRDRRRVVFIVEEDAQRSVARLREPMLAAGFGQRLHILDGVAPGDLVVISGQERLLEGTAVSIVSED
jgi:membrane fusion protein (multidrug efflux system)